MKKIKAQISVALVCCILGFVLAYQFKTIAKQEKSVTVTDSAEITEEIEKLKTEKQTLQTKVNDLDGKLKAYEKASADTSSFNKQLYDELQLSREILGSVDIKGPGVVITITPQNLAFSNDLSTGSVIRQETLLYLVNELNFMGAEAVSINDVRITARTGIRGSSLGTQIFIGNERISPYDVITIKAIGNKEKIYKDLSFPGEFYLVPQANYKVAWDKKDEIKISKSTENFKLDYAVEDK